jgi:hypothetical protein
MGCVERGGGVGRAYPELGCPHAREYHPADGRCQQQQHDGEHDCAACVHGVVPFSWCLCDWPVSFQVEKHVSIDMRGLAGDIGECERDRFWLQVA